MRSLHRTADAMVALGRMSLDFGRVDRITFHQDGSTPESDTDHTVMLGLVACGLADRYFPHLDIGLIAQYVFVHDLPEVHAGDTPTLRMLTAAEKAAKRRREKEATRRIGSEFGKTMPWVPALIREYEAKAAPEARFVKAVDKLLPKITHILNGAVTIHKQGMSPEELAKRYDSQIGEMRAYAADFPELFELREVLVSWVLQLLTEQHVSASVAEKELRAKAHRLAKAEREQHRTEPEGEEALTTVDVRITAGKMFTKAQVGDRTVAVLWRQANDSGTYFVSDGSGPATQCDTHQEASAHLLRIAMGGAGVATVVHASEGGTDHG